MGWDTKVVLIAEGVLDEMCLPALFYEMDTKDYAQSTCVRRGDVLIYSFIRRKYLPYWEVEDFTKAFPSVRFTLLGGMLEDGSAIGGVIRISNGVVGDSYGFWDERTDFITYSHPEQLYRWFRFGGPEEQSRELNGKTKTFLPDEDGWGSQVEYNMDAEILALRDEVWQPPAAYGWEVEVIPTHHGNNPMVYDWTVRTLRSAIEAWSGRGNDWVLLDTLTCTADFFFRHGQFAEAEEVDRRALRTMEERKFYPHNAKEVMDRLVLLAEQRGDAAALQALRLHPGVAAGKFDEGETALARARTKVKAEQGDAQAQYEVGYAGGKSCNTWQGYRQALGWLLKAAEQGHPGAMYQLGKCYFLGLGLLQDHTAARSWLERAAGLGDGDAPRRLGHLYRFGLGVPRDVEMAASWYHKAKGRNAYRAQFVLEDLIRKNKPGTTEGQA